MKQIIKWVAIVAGVGFLIALFMFNQKHIQSTNSHTAGDVWNEGMVEGKADAPNHAVEYSDYFCAYCTDFRGQTSTDRFKKEYLDTGKVKVETRIVALLEEKSPNTRRGAEAAFCAADQHKFLQYTDDILPRIQADYFDKGVGTTKNGLVYKPIDELPMAYFETSAKNVGLDVAKFSDCVTTKKHDAEISRNTTRAIKLGVSGLPFVAINNYTTSGFDGSYDSLKMMMKAGGVR